MTRYDDESGTAAPEPLAELTDLRVEVGGRAIVDGYSDKAFLPPALRSP